MKFIKISNVFFMLLFFSVFTYSQINVNENGIKIFNKNIFLSKVYNNELALFNALASDYIYNDDYDLPNGKLQTFLKCNGFKYVNAIRDRVGTVDLEAILTSQIINNKKVVLVVFRGTRPPKSGDNIETVIDILTDADVRVNTNFSNDKNIIVHNGFFTSEQIFEKKFNKIYIQINKKLITMDSFLKSSDAQNANFIITGHSLGGGIATLFAARLMDHFHIKRDNIVLYTFGAPAVGNANFRYVFNDNPKTKMLYNYRVMNKYDPVPYLTNATFLESSAFKIMNSVYHIVKKVPKLSLVHIGNIISFDENLNLDLTPGVNILKWFKIVKEKKIYYHGTYIKALEKNLKSNIKDNLLNTKKLNALLKVHPDSKAINKFFDNYNYNLTIFKDDYKSELIKPTQNYSIYPYLYTYFGYIGKIHYIENSQPVQINYFKKTFNSNDVILRGTFKTRNNFDCDSDPEYFGCQKFILAIWGKDNIKKYYFVNPNGEINRDFVFNYKNAFKIKNTNIYYYKYQLFKENMEPIYIFTKDGNKLIGIRGDKFTFDKNNNINIENNYGVLFFQLNLEKARVNRVALRLNSLTDYISNTYSSLKDFSRKMTVKNFKELNDFLEGRIFMASLFNNNYKKILNNENYKFISRKLNEIAKNNQYVPLGYSYAYFYTINRVFHHKKVHQIIVHKLLENNRKVMKFVNKHYLKNSLNLNGTYVRVYNALKAWDNFYKGGY